MPAEQFEARMQELVAMMKSSAPARGYEEVLVAGEPEWRAENERKRRGIPVSDGTWNDLVAIAGRHGVPVPA